MRGARWLAATCAALTLWPCSPGRAAAQDSYGNAVRERRALEQAKGLEAAGRPEEAMRALEHLLAEQPQSGSALVLLSQVAERSGNPGRVLPAAEEAVRSDRSGAAVIRQVWIRALQAAGFQDSALSAARRWTEEQPTEPRAYAELSALWARSGDLEAAVRTLEEGRVSIGSTRLFVQELAVLQSGRGAYAAAAREWRAMLAWGDPGIEAVRRRLSDGDTSRREAVAALRGELSTPDATLLERKGGLRLALLVGEFSWAREIVRELVDELPEPAGSEVLRDYVARAGDAGDLMGASWAARILAEQSVTDDEARYWIAMSADLAYEARDFEAARESFLRLSSEATPGSDLHALSLRRLHAMTVSGEPGEAETLLREYTDLYPEEAQAAVEMGVETARAWMNRGEMERAADIVRATPAADARQAALQALVLGKLEILAGRPEAARAHLELAAAVPTGTPGDRIEALELLSAIAAADSAIVADLGAGLVALARAGDSGLLLGSVARWSAAGQPGGDRAAALAARELAAAGRAGAARTARLAIVEGWPDSAASPRALLDLARGTFSDDPDRAATWLESLIIDYPESAMAPVARSLLAELRADPAGS